MNLLEMDNKTKKVIYGTISGTILGAVIGAIALAICLMMFKKISYDFWANTWGMEFAPGFREAKAPDLLRLAVDAGISGAIVGAITGAILGTIIVVVVTMSSSRWRASVVITGGIAVGSLLCFIGGAVLLDSVNDWRLSFGAEELNLNDPPAWLSPGKYIIHCSSIHCSIKTDPSLKSQLVGFSYDYYSKSNPESSLARSGYYITPISGNLIIVSVEDVNKSLTFTVGVTDTITIPIVSR